MRSFTCRTVAWLVSVICVIQGIWILAHYEFHPELSRIVKRYPIDGDGTLYVAISDTGGATVPSIYRYYLHRKIEGDELALKALSSEGRPFLVTRDHGARVVIEGRRIKISVTDSVYRFSSPALLKNGDRYSVMDVWLDAKTDNSALPEMSSDGG